MVAHTQYTSRAVQSLINLDDDLSISDVGSIDAPEDIPSGSHLGIECEYGRFVCAWSIPRK